MDQRSTPLEADDRPAARPAVPGNRRPSERTMPPSARTARSAASVRGRGAAPLVPRLGAGLVRQLRRRGRLTALGAGVAVTVPALAAGVVEGALRNGPGVLFELVFVAASVVGALHVRRSDLVAAPISAPIAFGIAVVVSVGFAGGAGGANALLAVVTTLSAGAPWLFTGTILAGTVAGLRFALAPRRRGRAGGAARRRPVRR